MRLFLVHYTSEEQMNLDFFVWAESPREAFQLWSAEEIVDDFVPGLFFEKEDPVTIRVLDGVVMLPLKGLVNWEAVETFSGTKAEEFPGMIFWLVDHLIDAVTALLLLGALSWLMSSSKSWRGMTPPRTVYKKRRDKR